METLSKEQREIERNAAYEALHYACLQSLEILKPDATTGRCEPENVARPAHARKSLIFSTTK